MVEDKAPARRRLGAHGMIFRRRRVFARLREGWTYGEIANEEGVSSSRIRQIVSKSCSNGRSTAEPNMRSYNWIVSLPRCNSGPRPSRRAMSRRSVLT